MTDTEKLRTLTNTFFTLTHVPAGIPPEMGNDDNWYIPFHLHFYRAATLTIQEILKYNKDLIISVVNERYNDIDAAHKYVEILSHDLESYERLVSNIERHLEEQKAADEQTA